MIELRATAYTVGTNFVITAAQSCPCKTITQLCNGEQFRLITCLKFPALTTVLPVYVQINGTAYPVLDRLGNTLYSDQIRSRRCYRLDFGAKPAHFILRQDICPSQAMPCCVTLPAAAGEGAE